MREPAPARGLGRDLARLAARAAAEEASGKLKEDQQ
jgi:hypothetical protein